MQAQHPNIPHLRRNNQEEQKYCTKDSQLEYAWPKDYSSVLNLKLVTCGIFLQGCLKLESLSLMIQLYEPSRRL
jgi:hypothetical protein